MFSAPILVHSLSAKSWSSLLFITFHKFSCSYLSFFFHLSFSVSPSFLFLSLSFISLSQSFLHFFFKLFVVYNTVCSLDAFVVRPSQINYWFGVNRLTLFVRTSYVIFYLFWGSKVGNSAIHTDLFQFLLPPVVPGLNCVSSNTI